MKHSIRLKLVLTLTVLLLSSIFVCWFINRQFLADYYEKYKVKTSESLYTEVDKIVTAYTQDGDYDKFELTLDQLAANKNVSINVFSGYILNGKNTRLILKLYYPAMITEQQQMQLEERISKYYVNEIYNIPNQDQLKITDEYLINKVFDNRNQSNYIELFATLQGGQSIYIRSNYEEIRDSVDIANRFLAYVGAFVTLIGIIVTYFVSRSFTKPILELAGVAKSMTNLDFNVRYKEKRQDEIGILGDSINNLSEQLENTISELKTANNQLQKDIANKIQIDDMRKEFLSNVTHELKTPIALIQGYAEGLQMDVNDGDEESRQFYCDVIIDEAAKMNTMVKKLLSLNQIESGNNLVEFERFDIVEVIQSVLNSTDIMFQQKNIKVVFEQKDPVFVWADEYMIEEVITNYISNAVNHVESPNLIEVKLIQRQDVVRIAVFNTGTIIPEEDIDNVWIKFYKVDKARTREYGGNGIGLSIVKAIMEAHNQNYGVVNHETGVEFWFELDNKRN